jgi:hypothetical protein
MPNTYTGSFFLLLWLQQQNLKARITKDKSCIHTHISLMQWSLLKEIPSVHPANTGN